MIKSETPKRKLGLGEIQNKLEFLQRVEQISDP